MDIRIDQIIFQLINFGILLFVLKKFLYKPVLKILDERAQRIKDGLEAAEKNVRINQKLEIEQEKIIESSKKDSLDIIKKAKTEAENLIKKAKEDAKAEAKLALLKERQAFDAQMDKARRDFQQEMAQTVLSATKAVLKGSLDDKLQEEIIKQQIKQFDVKLVD